MAEAYRITVKGVMSERFCRGLSGLAARPGAGRTVLEGGLPAGTSLDHVLSKLGNLGVEVLEVEPLGARPNPGKEA